MRKRISCEENIKLLFVIWYLGGLHDLGTLETFCRILIYISLILDCLNGLYLHCNTR